MRVSIAVTGPVRWTCGIGERWRQNVEDIVTTAPLPDDFDEAGVEQRICALCRHDESDHELVEQTAATPGHGFCRACDDAHEFEPLPD
jgi:hypothetical protein